jgi:hypothetical protein
MRRFLVYGLIVITLCACARKPSLVGRWHSAPPASMLFEIRADHSVLLYQHDQVYRVFNYKIIDSDTLQLYDGMGRLRQVDFEIVGDRLLLYDPGSGGSASEIWIREK